MTLAGTLRTAMLGVLLGAGALGAACRVTPDAEHGPGAPRDDGPAVVAHPEPVPPHGTDAWRTLFAGLGDVEGPLRALRQRASPAGTRPHFRRMAEIEAAVERRFRGRGPMGPLRHVLACGWSGHFACDPATLADLLMDPEVERWALGAEGFDAVGSIWTRPEGTRRLFRVALLDRGSGPLKFDFRFTTAMERWNLPDGSVMLRYDPWPVPPPEHVTLYRGAAWIEPTEGGSIATEMLVLGTDVTIPFLEGRMRSATLRVFRTRMERLWRRAGEDGREEGGR